MEVIILVKEDIEYLKNNLPFWDKLNHLEKKEIINNTENVKVLKKESVYSGKNNCTGIALIKKGLLPGLKLGSLKIRKESLEEFTQKYEGMDMSDLDNIKELNVV